MPLTVKIKYILTLFLLSSKSNLRTWEQLDWISSIFTLHCHVPRRRICTPEEPLSPKKGQRRLGRQFWGNDKRKWSKTKTGRVCEVGILMDESSVQGMERVYLKEEKWLRSNTRRVWHVGARSKGGGNVLQIAEVKSVMKCSQIRVRRNSPKRPVELQSKSIHLIYHSIHWRIMDDNNEWSNVKESRKINFWNHFLNNIATRFYVCYTNWSWIWRTIAIKIKGP